MSIFPIELDWAKFRNPFDYECGLLDLVDALRSMKVLVPIHVVEVAYDDVVQHHAIHRQVLEVRTKARL